MYQNIFFDEQCYRVMDTAELKEIPLTNGLPKKPVFSIADLKEASVKNHF
jgi:hypothetical protein